MTSKVFGNQDSSRRDDKGVYANGRLFIMDKDFKESYSIEISLWVNLEIFEASWNEEHIGYAWNILIFDEDDKEIFCKQFENTHLFQAVSLAGLESYNSTLDETIKVFQQKKFYTGVVVPYAYEVQEIKNLSNYANGVNIPEGELHHSRIWQFIHNIILLPEKESRIIDKQKDFI